MDTQLTPLQLGIVPSRHLTPKNRLFIQHIVDGKDTIQAYELAGYKGNSHSAYTLKSYLKSEIVKAYENAGVDRVGLMSELGKLLVMPLADDARMSIDNKLSALRLLAKITEPTNQPTSNKPQLTAFIVNNGPTMTHENAKVIDTHIISTDVQSNEP